MPNSAKNSTICTSVVLAKLNIVGIDLTLRIAQKCMQDKNQEIRLYEEQLPWAMVHCPQDNMYMITATFLLKLHLCEVLRFLM